MYEHSSQPVISSRQFYFRLAQQFVQAGTLIIVSLLIGVCGYHYFESLSWLDSLLNAAMILGGMGPVDTLQTVGGKLFASAYAIFCGLIFIAMVGVLLGPVLHRIIHTFHYNRR